MTFDIRYDRRVTEDFLHFFEPDGPAGPLVSLVREARYPLDLQFRRSPKTKAQHATVYVGLTGVLNILDTAKGLKLKAHPTWAHKRYGWEGDWGMPIDWSGVWPAVELYLERVVPAATSSHGLTEGAVQSAISTYGGNDWIMLDREVTPSFRNAKFKAEVLAECMQPVLAAVRSRDFKAGKVPARFGAECDLLAVDGNGRLLAVEVKPLAGGGLAWVAAQSAMYSRVLQRWVDDENEQPREVLQGMLAQRQAVGLCGAKTLKFPKTLRVTPVVALQKGASVIAKERMLAVRDALDEAGISVEILEVSMTGKLHELS